MKLLSQQSLKKWNTFGIESFADQVVRVASVEELDEAVRHAQKNKLPITVLGGGSNVLLKKRLPGLLIKMEIAGFQLLEDEEDEVVVEVGAGENWHETVLKTLDKKWFGLENLSLIPGTVGAAPIQNIGAYGVELKDFCEGVFAFHIQDKEIEYFANEDCDFGYRDSIFKNSHKGEYIVTSVLFRLSKKPKVEISYGQIKEILASKGIHTPSPKDVSEAVIHIRSNKLPDPQKVGNAGSFFKNPVVDWKVYESLKEKYPEIPSFPVDESCVKIPAGWLIEKQGWKGKQKGQVGVHAQQALVLVNTGGAIGAEVYALAKEIQNDIQETFGISLEMEVNVLGE